MSLLPIKIFEYDRDSGSLSYTENVPLVPELKVILDKYQGDASMPYMVYVHMMTSFDSPFANVDDDEKSDAIIFDIHQLYQGFDPDEPLLEPAIERLSSAYDSPIIMMAKQMEQEVINIAKTLKNTPIILGGDDDNFKSRTSYIEKMDKITSSYNKVKKQAEEEIKTKMRGKAQLGDY